MTSWRCPHCKKGTLTVRRTKQTPRFTLRYRKCTCCGWQYKSAEQKPLVRSTSRT